MCSLLPGPLSLDLASELSNLLPPHGRVSHVVGLPELDVALVVGVDAGHYEVGVFLLRNM